MSKLNTTKALLACAAFIVALMQLNFAPKVTGRVLLCASVSLWSRLS